MAKSVSALLPYLNLALGLRLDYPADWQVREQQTPQASAVAFISPRESPADNFFENLVIVIEPVPMGTSAEDYARGCLQNMQNGQFQFLSQPERQQVAGMPAYGITYNLPLTAQAPMAGKARLVLLTRADRGYSLTYTAEASHYDTFLPVIEAMIASVTLS